MKKIISFMLSLLYVSSLSYIPTYAEEKDDFQDQLSEMISEYEEDYYFSVMSVKIGESEINIDGEAVPIDDDGTVPYVENGRTMMPVRGIAEAMGAEVAFDEAGQVVTVESAETTVCMTIGLDEMKVNGEAVALLNAPEIVNDRTLLPVRDVAEALDCEVEWVDETETAVFTRPLQTKRIIAFSENAENDEAVMQASGEGVTVMQFKTIEDTENALEDLESKGITAEPDYVRKISSMSWGIDDIGSKSYYNETSYAAGSAVVAVVDTGVDLSHSYFNGKLVSGYDFYDNDANPQDLIGHGTHVASTVLDVAGFNSNIKVMPIKVFGATDSAYSTTIAQGIRYAADNGADVVNLSVGGQHYSDYEQEAINYAYNKNVAVVAAANTISGEVIIKPSYTFDALVKYFAGTNNFVKDVTISASGAKGVTGADGKATLTVPLQKVTISAQRLAEANAVTAYDASLVLQNAIGKTTLTENQKKAADVDGNNVINEYDAALILQMAVRKIDAFPTSASWIFVPASIDKTLSASSANSVSFTAISLGDVDGSFKGDSV